MCIRDSLYAVRAKADRLNLDLQRRATPIEVLRVQGRSAQPRCRWAPGPRWPGGLTSCGATADSHNRADVMRHRVPDSVAYIDGADVEQGEVLYLTIFPHGQSVRLEGIGRLIWTVAAEGRDVVAEIAELVRQPRDAIATDVTRFLDDMLDRGLLTAADDEVLPRSTTPRRRV